MDCRRMLALLAIAVVATAAFAEYNPTEDALFLLTYDNPDNRRENSVTGSGVGDAVRGGSTFPSYGAGRMGGDDAACHYRYNRDAIEYVSALNVPQWGLAFWFRTSDTTMAGPVISRSPMYTGTTVSVRGWRVYLDCENHEFVIGHSGVFGALQFTSVPFDPDLEWHHFVMNCSFVNQYIVSISIYVDGVNQTTYGVNMGVSIGGDINYPSYNSTRDILIGAQDTMYDGELIVNRWSDIHLDNVAMYCTPLSPSKIDTLFKGGWMPDPDPDASGQFTIPVFIHKVLYDPPGDLSYSYMMQDTTYSTSLSTNVSFGTSSTTTAGFEVGFSYFGLFDVNAGGQLSSSVSSSIETQTRATWSLTESRSIATGQDENADYIGPVNGDVIVAQQSTFGWRLWKKLKTDATPPIVDDTSCFDYRLAYWPLADQPEDTVGVYTVDQFMTRFSGFPNLVDSIVNQLAIDPATRRVRPELVSSGILTGETPFSWSASEITESRTATMSRSFSYSYNTSMDMSASVSAKIGPLSSSHTASMSIGMGGEQGMGVTFSQTCGYRWYDNEGWDRFAITEYLDTRTGTYVFDIDKNSSYASFPFEEDHALRAVDWTVETVNPPAEVPAGQAQVHTIRVTNTSPDVSGLPDRYAVKLRSTGSTLGVNLVPSEDTIPRGEYRDFEVHLTSPSEGSFPADVVLDLLRPSSMTDIVGESRTVQLTGEFTTPDRGVFIRATQPTLYVDNATSGSVTHPFTAVMTNLSAQSEDITSGVSAFSTGTAASVRSYSNPVASGDSVSVVIDFTCSPLSFPHTAVFWARVDTFSATRQEVTLTIDTIGSILVQSPSDGDLLTPGNQTTIAWSSTGAPLDSVDIAYSTDGDTWEDVATVVASAGLYQWTVPTNLEGDTIQVRVTDKDNPALRLVTVDNVAVEPMVAVRARLAGLGINDVRFTVLGNGLRVQFGDPGVTKLQLYTPGGRLVESLAVADGLAVLDASAVKAGATQTLLAAWQTGQGARKIRRVVLR